MAGRRRSSSVSRRRFFIPERVSGDMAAADRKLCWTSVAPWEREEEEEGGGDGPRPCRAVLHQRAAADDRRGRALRRPRRVRGHGKATAIVQAMARAAQSAGSGRQSLPVRLGRRSNADAKHRRKRRRRT